MASKTVLVIDADSETEQIIASTLESEGYLVFAVPGGDVGTEMAQKVKPSLIFVSPEDMSERGMEVCKTIRSYESLKSVPIILLVSRPAGADLLSYGITDTIVLPVKPDELLQKTGKAVGAKAPVVVRVKEKASAFQEEEAAGEGPLPGGVSDAGTAKSRLSDLSEIPGLEDEAEEIQAAPQKDWNEDVESYLPEEPAAGKKSKKVLAALLAVLVIVAAAAGGLYFSGLIPGMGPGAKPPVSPPQTVRKQTPPAAPAAVPQGQKAAEEKAPPAPAAPAVVKTPPPAAPSSGESKAVAPKKSSGKAVYSVQVGAFRSEHNAGELAKKLKGKGYDAFTLKSGSKDKGVVYRVLIGKIEDRMKAREMAATVSKKEKTKAVIFSE